MQDKVYPTTHDIYDSEQLFRDEVTSLLHREWTFAGTTDRLGATDAWFVQRGVNRSVVVTRDRNGGLHAFLNACRHRGAELCKAGQHGAGKLKCPYHGWVYGSDGNLLGATRRNGLPAFQNSDMRLIELEVDHVGRFIFVRDAGTGRQTLREFLGPAAQALEGLSAAMHSPFADIELEIAANWKVAISGGVEDYHVPFVHKESFGKVQPQAAESRLYLNGHSMFRVPFRAPRAAQALARYIVDHELHDQQENHLVFPNLLVVRTWTVISTHQMIPLDRERTLRVSRLYDAFPLNPAWTPKGALQRAFRRGALRVAAKVYEEDRQISEVAARGARTIRHVPRGPAHAEEMRVEHFLSNVASALGRTYEPYGASQPNTLAAAPTAAAPDACCAERGVLNAATS